MTESANTASRHSNTWRIVDIVVAAIIAVASGVIFWGWDIVCSAPLAILDGVSAGLSGLLNCFWLFAGPLAAIIVRKPGAALFGELLAALLELTLGNQWGVGGSLIVGLMQGAFAELAFLIFAYRAWNVLSTTLSGALAGAACALYYWFTNPGWGPVQMGTYMVTSVVSGAVVAGALMWVLHRAIATTGVLDRFESGRSRALV